MLGIGVYRFCNKELLNKQSDVVMHLHLITIPDGNIKIIYLSQFLQLLHEVAPT